MAASSGVSQPSSSTSTACVTVAPTRVRTTLTGLRIKASLVSPDGVRRPPQHFDFDLQVEVDLGSGYLTELLVLPR